jgi:indole-3-glycerol phosphate synthase
MNILTQIIEHKRKEVAERKALYPVRLLEQSIYFQSPTVSLKKYIQRPDKPGIIAEIKRKSPSRGVINGTNFSGLHASRRLGIVGSYR